MKKTIARLLLMTVLSSYCVPAQALSQDWRFENVGHDEHKKIDSTYDVRAERRAANRMSRANHLHNWRERREERREDKREWRERGSEAPVMSESFSETHTRIDLPAIKASSAHAGDHIGDRDKKAAVVVPAETAVAQQVSVSLAEKNKWVALVVDKVSETPVADTAKPLPIRTPDVVSSEPVPAEPQAIVEPSDDPNPADPITLPMASAVTFNPDGSASVFDQSSNVTYGISTEGTITAFSACPKGAACMQMLPLALNPGDEGYAEAAGKIKNVLFEHLNKEGETAQTPQIKNLIAKLTEWSTPKESAVTFNPDGSTHIANKDGFDYQVLGEGTIHLVMDCAAGDVCGPAGTVRPGDESYKLNADTIIGILNVELKNESDPKNADLMQSLIHKLTEWSKPIAPVKLNGDGSAVIRGLGNIWDISTAGSITQTIPSCSICQPQTYKPGDQLYAEVAQWPIQILTAELEKETDPSVKAQLQGIVQKLKEGSASIQWSLEGWNGAHFELNGDTLTATIASVCSHCTTSFKYTIDLSDLSHFTFDTFVPTDPSYGTVTKTVNASENPSEWLDGLQRVAWNLEQSKVNGGDASKIDPVLSKIELLSKPSSVINSADKAVTFQSFGSDAHRIIFNADGVKSFMTVAYDINTHSKNIGGPVIATQSDTGWTNAGAVLKPESADYQKAVQKLLTAVTEAIKTETDPTNLARLQVIARKCPIFLKTPRAPQENPISIVVPEPKAPAENPINIVVPSVQPSKFSVFFNDEGYAAIIDKSTGERLNVHNSGAIAVFQGESGTFISPGSDLYKQTADKIIGILKTELAKDPQNTAQMQDLVGKLTEWSGLDKPAPTPPTTSPTQPGFEVGPPPTPVESDPIVAIDNQWVDPIVAIDNQSVDPIVAIDNQTSDDPLVNIDRQSLNPIPWPSGTDDQTPVETPQIFHAPPPAISIVAPTTPSTSEPSETALNDVREVTTALPEQGDGPIVLGYANPVDANGVESGDAVPIELAYTTQQIYHAPPPAISLVAPTLTLFEQVQSDTQLLNRFEALYQDGGGELHETRWNLSYDEDGEGSWNEYTSSEYSQGFIDFVNAELATPIPQTVPTDAGPITTYEPTVPVEPAPTETQNPDVLPPGRTMGSVPNGSDLVLSTQPSYHNGFGVHYPQGLDAVEYLFGPDGTYRAFTEITNRYNYYTGWEGGASGNQYPTGTNFGPNTLAEDGTVIDGSVIFAATGDTAFTTPDANRHPLFNLAYGETATAAPGQAFHGFIEHNGMGVNGESRTLQFSELWFDGNYAASYFTEAYGAPSPDGLYQTDDFNVWQILSGDRTNWEPFMANQNIAWESWNGMYELAGGNYTGALTDWNNILTMAGDDYDAENQRYSYFGISDYYLLGMFKILTERMISSGYFSGDQLNTLIQHSASLRSNILSTQSQQNGEFIGWLGSADPNSLIGTETTGVNVLALGAGAKHTFEAGLGPMSTGPGYFYRPEHNVLSAVVGETPVPTQHMVYGPYMQFATGSYDVDFYLRAPNPSAEEAVATIDVYDSRNSRVLASQTVTGSQMVSGNQWTRVTLPTLVRDEDNQLEFRVWWHGTTNLDVSTIRVR